MAANKKFNQSRLWQLKYYDVGFFALVTVMQIKHPPITAMIYLLE